jgi:5-methylcytosine-specific restriction endonuclease McrA
MERKSKVDSISSEEFKALVQDSPSIMEVLRKLGYKNRSGAMHKKVKERIDEDGLSTDHMNRLNNSAYRNSHNKTPMKKILVENSTYTNNTRMKIRIINEGVLEYKCEGCGNEGEWLGKAISLQLDHINGVNNDNRIENLRFLCPNCHSQTNTYSGKNQGKYG